MAPPKASPKPKEEVEMSATVGQISPQPVAPVESGAPVMKIGGAQTYNPPSKPAQDGERRWTLQQLRATDAMIPGQYGTNQFDSQKGMTGFGTPRNTSTAVHTTNPNLPPTVLPPEENLNTRIGKWTVGQLKAGESIVRPQSGSNQFASQRGMAIGSSRDVRGKHLHRLWENGMYDDEIAAEKASYEQLQQQH